MRRSLNYDKIKFSSNVMSVQEALKEVTPLDIPKDVLDGKKRMVVNDCKPGENGKMGVSISYV